MLQQQRHGSLAVGTGNTYHSHGAGGIIIEGRTQLCQSQSVRGNQDIGNILLGPLGGDHCHSPLFQSHGDKAVTIGGKAGNGNKQAAWAHLSGIVANIQDLQLEVSMNFQGLQFLE
jgi:hypothetical protein